MGDKDKKEEPEELDELNCGRALSLTRQFSGLTQQEVVDRVSISQGYLSALENGTKVPSLHSLQKLAKVYGCPVWQMLWLAEQGIDTFMGETE
jgi:transcriptional regulator with XRE-family HTH domain